MPTSSSSTRREFLRLTGQGLGLAALAGFTPKLLSRPSFLSPDTTNEQILVVIHLAGGNDGLNTLVPYADDNYYRLRPRIAIPAAKALKLNESFGLHPACGGLRDLYDSGQLSVIQNVGYENPNRTHFGSSKIWASANLENDSMQTGWLGRYLDHHQKSAAISRAPAAIHFSSQTPLALRGKQDHRIARYDATNRAFSFASESIVSSTLGERDLQQFVPNDSPSGNYPETPFATNLRTTAKMIGNDLTTKIYQLTLNGFDTHSHQATPHENVLHDLSKSLAAFQSDLRNRQIADKVLTVAFSEFGRRPSENATRGTDHGTAGPIFVLGSSIKGGIYGTSPSLEIAPYEDLVPTTDFRRVYVTLLEDWLHTPAALVLGGTSAKLPIL